MKKKRWLLMNSPQNYSEQSGKCWTGQPAYMSSLLEDLLVLGFLPALQIPVVDKHQLQHQQLKSAMKRQMKKSRNLEQTRLDLKPMRPLCPELEEEGSLHHLENDEPASTKSGVERVVIEIVVIGRDDIEFCSDYRKVRQKV